MCPFKRRNWRMAAAGSAAGLTRISKLYMRAGDTLKYVDGMTSMTDCN